MNTNNYIFIKLLFCGIQEMIYTAPDYASVGAVEYDACYLKGDNP